MAFDFWKKKSAATCKPATAEEIWDALTDITISGDTGDRFRQITVKLPEEHIPWDSLRTLLIYGRADEQRNVNLYEARIQPGAYTNADRTCLVLIHPEESTIQGYLDRCGIRLTRLYLRNTFLERLDFSALTALKILDAFSNPRLLTVSGLSQLSCMTTLDLSWCENLRELPGLGSLTQLTTLALSWCRSLRELPGLGRLTQLTTLNLSWCEILRELPGLGSLTRLTSLNLSYCDNLRELPGLENLTQLTTLDLSWCRSLRELPEGIRNLKSLRQLDLKFMHLRELPDWLPDISEGFSLSSLVESSREKAIVYLHDTTVDSIPDMSIFLQPYEVVAEWFRKRSQGDVQTLNEIKVVFLGDGEAGKSHTIARLMNDGGEPDFAVFDGQSTPGIVIRNKDYTWNDRNFRVHYWDFGGQEIMHSMHRIFLTGRTMYVILLNARDDTQGDRARYWLHNVKSFAPDAPVLLVLNKIDQNENASVDEPDLQSRYEKLTRVVKLSALNFSPEEFNQAFTQVLLEEIHHTGFLDAQWPTSWIRVKEELENMSSHYIMGTAYQEICAQHQVDENQKPLLHWFNDLGISFCCCSEEDYALEDYVILRPDWITNALYIILFNHLEGARNGLIPHKSIYDLLKNAHTNPSIRCTMPQARYTAGDIQYVLGIMRKFSLSFPHGDDHEFLPMLCQQNSTVNVQYYRQDPEVLEFNMEFDYLPNNLLHRLMVDRHAELDMENVWRTGARFCHKELGYSAVVVIDGNILRFFIRHTDPMHRPNTYLTVLKANVERIVGNMGLKVPITQLVYKLDGKQDVFDYETLKAMLEVGQTQVFSMTWRRMIPIQDILNQSAPDGLQNETLLLTAIQEACGRIQDDPIYRLVKNSNGKGYENGKGMEDLRNRRVRDDLLILLRDRYQVCDQTQIGSSGSGKSIGELDMLIRKKNNEPWTIIEALRIEDGKKGSWNDHLDKLLVKYNSRGLSLLYLLTYVDADPRSFTQICKEYKTHIPRHASGQYTYVAKSLTELDCNNSQSFQAVKCRYTCGGDPVTVYHIFARIEPKQSSRRG